MGEREHLSDAPLTREEARVAARQVARDIKAIFRCGCVWNGVRCDADATQEDGLCDWCGVRRPEDLKDSPWLMADPDGKYLGLAGGSVTPFNHQAGRSGIPDDARPSACWMERGDW